VLRELVVRDDVPVSEDDKSACVVLRRPAGIAEQERGEELQVVAEDDGREDKGKKQSVRWGKVDGERVGRRACRSGWLRLVQARSSLSKRNGRQTPLRLLTQVGREHVTQLVIVWM
jgi:hypothetical protein